MKKRKSFPLHQRRQKDSAFLSGVLVKTSQGTLCIEPTQRHQKKQTLNSKHLDSCKEGELIQYTCASSLYNSRGRNKNLQKNISIISKHGCIIHEQESYKIALHNHDIPDIFPDDVLEETKKIAPIDMNNRQDWRHFPFITIDPSDAKDHDDAVLAFADEDKTNPNGVVVMVAISDVAAYVPLDSPLDKHALIRGNSVYFPGFCVPMLPEHLSHNLCSLKSQNDRPVLAVSMIFDAQGYKIRHRFHRAMIRIRENLSYQDMQNFLDKKANLKTASLKDHVLDPLLNGWNILKKTRERRHSLRLSVPERNIILNANQTVEDVIIPQRLESCEIIEECMIQANIAAAETLEEKKIAFLYRIHEAPLPEKKDNLRRFLETVHFPFSKKMDFTSKDLNQILMKIQGSKNETLINEIILRSQSQAIYSPHNKGHFGLDLPCYTHFTSPIRRYADLIVHRSLIFALSLGEGGFCYEKKEELKKIGDSLSQAERRAIEAERETFDRLVGFFLSRKLSHSFEANISGVTKTGLFVRLVDSGAEGFVPLREMEKSSYYVFDEKLHALYEKKSAQGYQLSDSVRVRLLEASPFSRRISFEILSPPKSFSLKKRKPSFSAEQKKLDKNPKHKKKRNKIDKTK